MLSSAIAGPDNGLLTFASLAFHDPGFSALVLALAFLLMLRFKDSRAFPLLLSLLLSFLVIQLLKEVIAVPRPCTELISKVACPLTGSFPSGHATVSSIFITASIGTPLFPYFLILGMLVSFSRIYLGLHAFSDIAAGFAIGAVLYSVAERTYHDHTTRREGNANIKRNRGPMARMDASRKSAEVHHRKAST